MIFIFLFFGVFRVLVYNTDCPGAHYVDNQDGLKFATVFFECSSWVLSAKIIGMHHHVDLEMILFSLYGAYFDFYIMFFDCNFPFYLSLSEF